MSTLISTTHRAEKWNAHHTPVTGLLPAGALVLIASTVMLTGTGAGATTLPAAGAAAFSSGAVSTTGLFSEARMVKKVNREFPQKMMLTLLAFSYANGLLRSDEIEDRKASRGHVTTSSSSAARTPVAISGGIQVSAIASAYDSSSPW